MLDCGVTGRQLLVSTRAETGEPTWDPRACETPTGTLLTVCPSIRRRKLTENARLPVPVIKGMWAVILAGRGCFAAQFATDQDQQCIEPLPDLQLPQCARARQVSAQKGFHIIRSSLSQI